MRQHNWSLHFFIIGWKKSGNNDFDHWLLDDISIFESKQESFSYNFADITYENMLKLQLELKNLFAYALANNRYSVSKCRVTISWPPCKVCCIIIHGPMYHLKALFPPEQLSTQLL